MRIEKLIKKKALPSFCTSNLDVLKTAIYFCKKKNFPILIESTSSQVNQNGGYSGKKPKDFYYSVNKIAKQINFPEKKLYVGGDHLGPLPWRNLKANLALRNSVRLINDCLKSNYSKIHIDTSIKCSDDKTLSAYEIYLRTKKILEKINKNKKLKKVFLVIGTEVPLSGSNDKSKLKLTSERQIFNDVKKFKKIKVNNGVFGLVIEPGMKFMHYQILSPKFKNFKAKKSISKNHNFVYEAHSSDYQSLLSLKKLVKNNFKFLKVGPELTFYMTRGIFFMEDVEKKYFLKNRSNIKKKIFIEMMKNRKYWSNYYSGKKKSLKKLIFNSRLDRMRYYLNKKNIEKSKKILKKNINKLDRRLILKILNKKKLSKYNEKDLDNFDLINLSYLGHSLEKYYKACGYRA